MQSDSEHSNIPSNDPRSQILVEIGRSSDSTPPVTARCESSEPLIGYELVADLMRRQDDVIAELDELNVRIESAIKEISEARHLQEQSTHDAAPQPNSADTPSPASAPFSPIQKVA